MLESSNWIVQKFGGTSIGKFPIEIVNNIIRVYIEEYNNNVAVVCSACSSYTKAEGTTSRLLTACNLAVNDSCFIELLNIIRSDHVRNSEIIKDKTIQLQLIKDTNNELDNVEKFLNASRILGEVSPRTTDLVMSAGEKLSCLFMTAVCKEYNIPVEYVDLSSLIPSDYCSDSGSLDNNFYTFLVMALKKKLEPILQFHSSGRRVVPIITGFFGLVPMGLLNTVGRGYTDLCAALVAIALNANELQVWKEVDGIFTADPRKVPHARLIDTVTPDEAAELSYYGSEVIHPFTMEQAINARIPIRIKNVQNPKGNGTVIYPDNIAKKGEATPPHPPEELSSSFFSHKKRGPTAVTTKSDIIVLNIHSNKKTLSHGFLAQIFSTLDKHKLVVDLISTSEVYVSMALPVPDSDSVKALKRAVDELKKLGSVDVTKKLAIISLVGQQMKQFIGIAGSMFTTLAEQGINIEMISQGANEINISCVIDESNAIKALQSIHDKLLDMDNKYQDFKSAIDERLNYIRKIDL